MFFFFIGFVQNNAISQCTVITAPWLDGFESHTLGPIPVNDPGNSQCWESPAYEPDWTVQNIPPLQWYLVPFEGIYHCYLETSTGPGTDYLESPEIDIHSLSSPQLTFHYYMYGAGMGTMSVEVWDGTTWSAPIWSLSGQQQTSVNDP